MQIQTLTRSHVIFRGSSNKPSSCQRETFEPLLDVLGGDGSRGALYLQCAGDPLQSTWFAMRHGFGAGMMFPNSCLCFIPCRTANSYNDNIMKTARPSFEPFCQQ